MKTIYKICKVCHGKGYVEFQDCDNATTAGTHLVTEPCLACNGEGKVETDFVLDD